MAKLKVDTKKYLEEIVQELNDSMNSEPEVTALEPEERKKEANKWLSSRLEQINYYQKLALCQLNKADEDGYLSSGDIVIESINYNRAFVNLRGEARDKYQKTIGQTSSST